MAVVLMEPPFSLGIFANGNGFTKVGVIAEMNFLPVMVNTALPATKALMPAHACSA